MGCSASRLDTLIAKAIEEPSYSSTSSSSISSNNSSSCISSSNNSSSCINSSKNSSIIPKTRSLSTPLIHHLPIKKGDTHHLVCLTSSTYGSLIVGNGDPFKQCGDPFKECSSDNGDGDFSGKNSPDSVINTWELMEGLEDDGIKGNYDYVNDDDTVFCDFKNAQKLPASNFVDFGSDFKVKTSNLCDFNDAVKVNLIDSSTNMKVPSSKLGLNLNDSYVFVDMPDEIVEENPNAKPLWKHLSEESLLSKMDPNVCNAYDRALLAKKLGYSQSGKVSKSVGSSLVVSKSKSMGSNTPVVSKILSNDSSRKVAKCEDDDKIVFYFTSLRGIRKTYEDCSSVRMILRGFRVVVDERDISMDSSYRKELQSALNGKAMSLPQLFIGGKHIGGAEDVMLLHETGELERILEGCRKKECGSVCRGCGDARFVPCSNCNGSRKVFQEEEGRTRRCPKCNENGLVRCPGCCS